MAEIYGPSFAAAYGDTAPPVWLAGIAQLTDEQCAKGFERLIAESRDFPPNLTQFMSACKPVPNSPRFLGVPTTPNEIRKLEAPKNQRPRIEDVDDWLASMRENAGKAKIRVHEDYRPRSLTKADS